MTKSDEYKKKCKKLIATLLLAVFGFLVPIIVPSPSTPTPSYPLPNWDLFFSISVSS